MQFKIWTLFVNNASSLARLVFQQKQIFILELYMNYVFRKILKSLCF